jgi:hypothetical protein
VGPDRLGPMLNCGHSLGKVAKRRWPDGPGFIQMGLSGKTNRSSDGSGTRKSDGS